MDWASVIICIWYSIHSSVQSHIHNKSLLWMPTEESDIFVVLSFHLLLPWNPVSVSVIIKVFTADSLIKIVSYKIYKIIVDLGVWHDTRREKYCIRHDTNGETVGFLLSLEYRTPGKSSVNQIWGPERTVCACVYIVWLFQKVHNTQYFFVMTLILKSLTPWWGIYIYILNVIYYIYLI